MKRITIADLANTESFKNAEEFGIDLTLLEQNLALTPAERLQKIQRCNAAIGHIKPLMQVLDFFDAREVEQLSAFMSLDNRKARIAALEEFMSAKMALNRPKDRLQMPALSRLLHSVRHEREASET